MVPLLAIGLGKEAPAQDLTAIIENTVINKNIFVGMNFGNKPMEQLYTTFGNKHLAFGTWCSYSLKDMKMQEVDYYLSSPIKVNKHLTLEPGAGHYTFPNTEDEDAQELYLEARTVGLPFDYYLLLGKAFGPVSNYGHIAMVTAKKPFDISKQVKLIPKIEFIYNDHYFTTASGFSHVGTNLALSFNLMKKMSVSATGTYQFHVSDAFEGITLDESYFTVSVTHTF